MDKVPLNILESHIATYIYVYIHLYKLGYVMGGSTAFKVQKD